MKIDLGIVAINKKTKTPYPGAEYRAGAKIYKSEKIARAAMSTYAQHYYFYPVTVEIPDEN